MKKANCSRADCGCCRQLHPAPVNAAYGHRSGGLWLLRCVGTGVRHSGRVCLRGDSLALTDYFIDARLQTWLASLSEPTTVLALASAALAGGLVLVSTIVKTMIPLRWLAVGSNVGFILYGFLQPAPLMVVLRAALLPINVWRVRQMIS